MLKEKITRIQDHIRRENQDFLLIGNFGHQNQDDLLYWLLLERLEYGYMLIPASGMPTLYAISFEVASLKSKRSDYIDIVAAEKPAHDVCAQLFAEKEIVLAIRPSSLPASLYQKLITMPTITPQPLMGDELLMMVKEEKEIARMRQAAKLTDIIFTELIDSWNDFYSEADAVNYILSCIAERGVEPSFPPIVASGKNAASPHHKPHYEKMQPGFCVIDFGVRFKGYCSDMTRTIYIGTPEKAEKHIYAHLLASQEKTITRVAPGMSVHELDAFCRTELGEELSQYFIHSLGHGLGSQVHEFPSVSKKSAATLQERMVITIEPGVYVPETYGIRIEDDVLVTSAGYDVLTQTKKSLITV